MEMYLFCRKFIGVSFEGWQVKFDAETYYQRLLSKNAKLAEKTIFLAKISELRCVLKSEARYQMHGHDFAEILAWYLRGKGIKKQSITASNLNRLLATALEHTSLVNSPAFKMLVSRTG